MAPRYLIFKIEYFSVALLVQLCGNAELYYRTAPIKIPRTAGIESGYCKMANRIVAAQVSDTTDDDSSNAAGNKNNSLALQNFYISSLLLH